MTNPPVPSADPAGRGAEPVDAERSGRPTAGFQWRVDGWLFLAACIWFLPGIWWGTPESDLGGRMASWAPDELGPFGAIRTVQAIIRSAPVVLTPQYPLGQPLVQAIFVWPYHLAMRVLLHFGWGGPSESVAVLSWLHRLPSILAAAGLVVVARQIGRRIAGEPAGWIAAAAVAVTGSLAYYARTSNVDAPACFWAAVGLLIGTMILRDGLTTRRAASLGLVAGVGTATKDQQYAFFLGLGLVVLFLHLADRRRRHGAESTWRAPLVGLAVGAAGYLLLSGILLLPTWFRWHVHFISGGAEKGPPEIQALRGLYYSNPATLAGYWQLAGDTIRQLVAALGIPLVGLALLGIAVAARRDRRVLALLGVPALAIVVGVLGLVRFVQPRFLLPVDFVLCLFAGYGVARTSPGRAGRSRALILVAVLGTIWAGVRTVDLTIQMIRDGRYRAAEWLARNVQPSDTVGFYGAYGKLPRLPADAVISPAPGQLAYDRRPLTSTPSFIVSVPQQPHEAIHEWSVPESTYQHLSDGRAGYRLVLAIQGPGLWPRPRLVAPYVNAPIRIFAREDVAARITERWIELTNPPPASIAARAAPVPP